MITALVSIVLGLLCAIAVPVLIIVLAGLLIHWLTT